MNIMGDMGDVWEGHKEYVRSNKANRREHNLKYILKVVGFTRKELTPYQYRFSHDSVGAFMDIYPTHARYHNIITGERGRYKTVQRFLELQLDRTSQFIANRQEGATNG